MRREVPWTKAWWFWAVLVVLLASVYMYINAAAEKKKKEEVLAEEERRWQANEEKRKMEDKIRAQFEQQKGSEKVDKTISTALSSISVSKNEYDKFQQALKEQMVEKWEESSNVEVFRGVKLEKYDKFLDDLQKSTPGISDETKEKLRLVGDTVDQWNGKPKTFHFQGVDTGGMYSMYMAVKHPFEEKVDVAFAVYTYNASFVAMNIWQMEKAGDGLYRKTKQVQKKLGGLTMEQIKDLGENFLTTKALMAFAHHGTIPKVTFVEDQAGN